MLRAHSDRKAETPKEWGTVTLGGRPDNGDAAFSLLCERGSHRHTAVITTGPASALRFNNLRAQKLRMGADEPRALESPLASFSRSQWALGGSERAECAPGWWVRSRAGRPYFSALKKSASAHLLFAHSAFSPVGRRTPRPTGSPKFVRRRLGSTFARLWIERAANSRGFGW